GGGVDIIGECRRGLHLHPHQLDLVARPRDGSRESKQRQRQKIHVVADLQNQKEQRWAVISNWRVYELECVTQKKNKATQTPMRGALAPPFEDVPAALLPR